MTDYFRLCSQGKEGFRGGSAVKNLPANAGDTSSMPGSLGQAV